MANGKTGGIAVAAMSTRVVGRGGLSLAFQLEEGRIIEEAKRGVDADGHCLHDTGYTADLTHQLHR